MPQTNLIKQAELPSESTKLALTQRNAQRNCLTSLSVNPSRFDQEEKVGMKKSILAEL
jgi:hypothetical protein